MSLLGLQFQKVSKLMTLMIGSEVRQTCAGSVAESPHLIHKQDVETELTGKGWTFGTTKPAPSDTAAPARLCLLTLNSSTNLGPNIHESMGPFSVTPPSDDDELFCFYFYHFQDIIVHHLICISWKLVCGEDFYIVIIILYRVRAYNSFLRDSEYMLS